MNGNAITAILREITTSLRTQSAHNALRKMAERQGQDQEQDCSIVVSVSTEDVVESKPFNKNEFLAEVQRYDCLYNKFNKDFKDKYKKMNCWTKIGQLFGMDASDAENKFMSLRSSYTRHMRKVQNIPSGSGADKFKHQEAEFAAFEWLRLYISSRQTTTNMSKLKRHTSNLRPSLDNVCLFEDFQSVENRETLDCENYDEVNNDNLPEIENSGESMEALEGNNDPGGPDVIVTDTCSKKKRQWSNLNKKPTKAEIDKVLMNTAKSIHDHLKESREGRLASEKNTNEEDDGASLFFQSLVPQFKRLPDRAKAYIRVQVEQLFFQAEFNLPGLSNADS